MTSILDHKPPQRWSFPIRIEVKWVLGIYIYLELFHFGRWTCFVTESLLAQLVDRRVDWSMLRTTTGGLACLEIHSSVNS